MHIGFGDQHTIIKRDWNLYNLRLLNRGRPRIISSSSRKHLFLQPLKEQTRPISKVQLKTNN